MNTTAEPIVFEESPDPEWVVEERGFDVSKNRHVEALMALGTGFMSIRSSLEERLADDDQSIAYDRRMNNVTLERIPAMKSKWGTYLPAVQADHPTLGRGIANLPYILGLEISANGVGLDAESILVHHQRRLLDLATATYYRSLVWEPVPGVELSVRFRRFMHENARFGIVQECSLTAIRGRAEIRVFGFIDTDVRTNGSDVFADRHLGSVDGRITVVITTNSGCRVAIASLLTAGREPCAACDIGSRAAGQRHVVTLLKRETLRIRKDVFLAADLYCGQRPLAAAIAGLDALAAEDADSLHRRHTDVWRAYWNDCDVEIRSAAADQRKNQLAVRCAIYHLLRSKAPGDALASVDAKGVTGDAYFGSVFWDTDIFALPFFVYCSPDRARGHVTFRARNLDAARQLATSSGYHGARYPWQSAADGRETCIPWQYADHEIHVTADVAIGIYHYVAATGDMEFLARPGIDVLVETARYWVDRVDPAPGADTYRILGVMGPDEYKPLVNDNAYTNFCARFALLRTLSALDALKGIPGALDAAVARLRIHAQELIAFAKIASGLRVPVDEARRIVWQCEGFEREFADPDFDSIWKDRKEPFGRIVSQERRLRTKCLKQGDVVALFALFPGAFDPLTMRASMDYYLPFTVHDSSLSVSQHALVAAKLGRGELAYEYWRKSREIDFGESATASDGIHLANAGGLWQALIFGFAGMDTALERDRFTVDPQLPSAIESIRFTLLWKARRISVHVLRDSVFLKNESLESLPVSVAGVDRILGPGEARAFRPKGAPASDILAP